ncbi:MAG: GerMN domain-containing protein [Propionibacteriaceae bacterium]|nr:GerMN domain-containing protein [Propionibacteriaceae bacterium]
MGAHGWRDRGWRIGIVLIALLAAATGFVVAAALRPPPAEWVSEGTVQSPHEAFTAVAGEQHYPEIAIYYVGRADGLLYREHRTLTPQGSVAETAVAALLNAAPLDPDYTSAWAPASGVRVESAGDLITVDLPAAAFAQIETAEQARQAIEALVYTVTDAMHTEVGGVQLLRDSSAILPGVFPSGKVFHRDGVAPFGDVWIATPSNGATITDGTVVVQGFVKPGVKDIRVSVQAADQDTPLPLMTPERSAEADQRWHTWQITLRLGPGTYEIGAQISGGVVDTKLIKVAATGQ